MPVIGRTRVRAVLSQVCALLLLLACASEAAAIEGGTPARPGDPLARATVAIGTITRPSGRIGLSHCTGVLIAPDLVLTAAHCVRDDPFAAAVLLYEGSKPISAPHWASAVATTVVPFGHAPDGDLATRLQELSLDVAVLRLSAPMRGRKPIAFLRNPQRLPQTMQLAGTGWSSKAAGTLKTTTLKPFLVTDSGVTIAQAVGAQVCIGDSGGPVVVQGKKGPLIWGIASAIIARQQPCSNIVIIAPAGLARLPA